MKKKILSLLMSAVVVMSMVGCGSTATTTPSGTGATQGAAASSGPSELALVIDVGTIDDKSFNQGSWEGLKKYGDEKGIAYKYYKAAEATNDGLKETLELAIEGGAKLVVCPGYLFEEPIYDVQTLHPDVKFIIIDGEPHDANYNYSTAANTSAVLYNSEQAGFLAGYAAVKDGYTKLGFMGGMAMPSVISFGYGYVEGADYAANELGVDVSINYTYTGSFAATPEVQSTATSWYTSGVEVIFACGGLAGNSIMAAAEASNGKVIGVDVDQSGESATVITSAKKMLANSVYASISRAYEGNFNGGVTTVFDIANDGVGIEMANAKWNKFTEADYKAIVDKLISGEIVVNADVEKEPTDLAITKATVNVIK